jgi:hypothetical protein
MTGPFTAAIPNIGHADAGNTPDGAALLWQDERLIRDTVDNKARFIEAAACMFAKLAKHADPKITKREINKRAARLKDDLGRCIGAPDPEDEMAGMRIARYSVLSLSQEYGGQEMPPYDADRWMDEAVNEDVRGLRDRGDFPLAQLDPFGDVYTWKDRANYEQTHWYLFQEAVKQHQNETWQLLEHKNFQGLDLPHL